MTPEVRRYVLLHGLTGVAYGCWVGAYDWLVYKKLGFSPSELSFIIGGQFIAQLVLQIPAGTWAETEDKRRPLVIAYVSLVLFCLIYFVTDLGSVGAVSISWIPAWLPLGDHSARHWAALMAAFIGELAFGVGQALSASILDAWIGDVERAAETEGSSRKSQIKNALSMRSLWGGTGSATIGTLAFVVAASAPPAWSVLPWCLALLLYSIALVVVVEAMAPPANARGRESDAGSSTGARDWRRITASLGHTLSGIAPWQKETRDAAGRFARRALFYLHEQPLTLRIIALQLLPSAVRAANTAFWLAYVLRVIGLSTDQKFKVLDRCSVLAVIVIWSGAEFATAAGMRESAEGAATSSDGSTPAVRKPTGSWWSPGLLMALITIAIAVQTLSVHFERRLAVAYFGVALIASRFLDGLLTRDLDAHISSSIVSERATHLSIGAFFRAFVSLCMIAGVGYLANRDAVSAYAFIALVAAVATVLLLCYPIVKADGGYACVPRAHSILVGYGSIFVVGAVLVACFAALAPVPALGVPWRTIAGVPVLVEANLVGRRLVTPAGRGVWSVRSPPSRISSDEWHLTANGSTEKPITCRITGLGPMDLIGTDLYGIDKWSTYAEYHDDVGSLSFTFATGKSTVEVVTTSPDPQPFRCSIGRGDSARMLPVRSDRCIDHLMVSPDVVIELAVGVLGLLGWCWWAMESARRGLLETAPDNWRDSLLQSADAAWPREIPTMGRELDGSVFLLGGFLESAGILERPWAIQYAVVAKVRSVLGGAYLQSVASLVARSSSACNFTGEWPLTLDGKRVDGMGGHYAVIDVVRSGAPGRRNVGFAVMICLRDRAKRYLDPVDRAMLRQLAHMALVEHRIQSSDRPPESSSPRELVAQ